MSARMEDRVNKAFKGIGLEKSLNGLSPDEKRLLCSLLTVYAAGGQLEGEKRRPDKAEKIEEIVTDAAALAKRIRQQVFEGDFAEPLRPFVGELQDVPPRLTALALRLRKVLDTVAGKPGHIRKVMRNRHLIMASEYVRLKTGHYYDEQLAELIQALFPDTDPDSGITADAIGHKRRHFKKTYPLLYSSAVRRVRKWAAFRDPKERQKELDRPKR